MKRRSILVSAIIGASSFTGPVIHFAFGGNSSTTQPTTRPGGVTTQPATPDIDQLIKQLGSDDAGDRDSAQRELVSRGNAAIDALKKAAEHDDDLEVRSRAAAALSQIDAHDSFDASPITLHLKDVSDQTALTAIAAQAHAQFAGITPSFGPGAAAHKTVSFNVDHEPFWDVMTDACRQMNICPVLLDTPAKNTLRLFSTPRNWFLQSPHQIVGPYWIGVAGIYRMRSIDLMGPQILEDQFSIRLIVFPEPKLAVTQISNFILKEARDDAGNSLMPTSAVPVPLIGGMGAGRVVRPAHVTPHLAEARLAYPEHPGKKISVIRGNVIITLAEGVQQFVVDDVLGAAKQSNPVNHCRIRTAVTHNSPDLFMVAVECTRDGMLDEQWSALTNRVNDITLEDAGGHPLTQLYNQPTGLYTESTFKSAVWFSRNIFTGQMPNGQVTGHTGDAKRLTWNIATRLKPVTVPVTFNDLPMP